MTETMQTNRFALFFFLYFIGVSFGMAYLPAMASLSDGMFMLLCQTVCILPPIIGYFIYTKKPVRQTLRLNPLGWKNVILIISFAFAIQPIMSFLSFLMGLFFPNPVEESMEGILASGFGLSFLAVAIVPALLEEISVRGVLLSGYKFLGTWKASFAAALLFGLMHLNPQQLPYAFCVGFIFCFLVERTNSIFASILPHLIINGTTVFSLFSEPAAATAAVEMSNSQILVSLGLMSLLSIPWLLFLLFLFLKVNPQEPELPLMDADTGKPYRERFFTPCIWIIMIIYVLFGILPYLHA